MTERHHGRPTLDEVARLAGVSRATASRAINGGSRVSPAAQKAVDEAVRELGFTPNPAARSLVTRRTESVALVVPEPDERVFSDPFFARALHGINDVLTERDLQLVLMVSRPGEEQRMLRYLRNGHVDGAIVVSHHRSDGLSRDLANLGMPCVFVGRPWHHADKATYVDADNVEGGRAAAQVLIDRGCRRIGTIAGPADMAAGADRLEGWRAALADAGLPDNAVAYGDFTEAGGAEAAQELLDRHPDLDGIVAASDLMAAGALPVIAARGLSVPEDIAIIGYDDLGVPERTTPRLTTLRNPIGDMAAQAARLLLDQLASEAGATPSRVIFRASVVMRGSA